MITTVRPFAPALTPKQERALAIMRAIFNAKPGREKKAVKRVKRRLKAAR